MEKLYMQDDNASIKRADILVSFGLKHPTRMEFTVKECTPNGLRNGRMPRDATHPTQRESSSKR
jgi:hypothetical protein